MRLKGAGLVHNPNLYLTALASQESPMDPKTPPQTPATDNLAAALADMLGLPPDTPPAELLAKLKEKLTAEPDPAKFMPVAAVQSMLAARGTERTALAAQQAEEKVGRAIREGYLTPAMKDWALALCRSDEPALDSFMEKAGPAYAYLLKPSHATSLPPGASLSQPLAPDLEAAVCEQLGLKPGTLSA